MAPANVARSCLLTLIPLVSHSFSWLHYLPPPPHPHPRPHPHPQPALRPLCKPVLFSVSVDDLCPRVAFRKEARRADEPACFRCCFYPNIKTIDSSYSTGTGTVQLAARLLEMAALRHVFLLPAARLPVPSPSLTFTINAPALFFKPALFSSGALLQTFFLILTRVLAPRWGKISSLFRFCSRLPGLCSHAV